MAINGKGRPTKEQAAEAKLVSGWKETVSEYEREFKKWEKRVEDILKKYRDDFRNNGSGSPTAKFNILWSNVQTLIPATFSRLPQPDVSRRFRDNDPVGRVASLILERALEYETQHYPDYRVAMNGGVKDRFLGGRGTAWARYEPHILAKPATPTDGVQVSDTVDEPDERLDYECAPTDYVHWKDFGHSVARTWDEVARVYRRVYMRMPAKIERFGDEVAKRIPKDSKPKENDRQQPEGEDEGEGSWIYEGWDKETKEAVWFHKSMTEFLDQLADPLGLEEFFPCPKPLYATLTNETLVPIPDYCLYQDQANSLDILCDRIEGLIKMLQVKGVYDGSADASLSRLFTEGSNGTLLPVKNWASFAEKNGLKGQIDVYDITPIFQALEAAYKAFEQQKQQVYEIMGIGDIVRGVSAASETLGAQEIKKQFFGLRLGDYKEAVACYATDILRLKAQIICTKFDPQTIAKIAGVEQLNEADKAYIPAAMALLIGNRAADPNSEEVKNPMRDFRIEIAADSMVKMDEEEEKQSRMEFLKAVGSYVKDATMLLQQSPEAAPLVVTLLKYGVTGFKVGKTVEGAIDAELDKLKQIAAAPKQPKPDPEMEKVKADQAAEQARIQADQAAEQARVQADAKANFDKMQMEAFFRQQDARQEAALQQQQAQTDAAMARFEAILKAQTAIQVAEIGAKATISAGQSAAAKQATR